MSEPVFTVTPEAEGGYTVTWKDGEGVVQTLPLREFQPIAARIVEVETVGTCPQCDVDVDGYGEAEEGGTEPLTRDQAQEIAEAMNMAYEMGRDHGRRREPPSVNDNLRALGVTW
jgi:hypothetical protein